MYLHLILIIINLILFWLKPHFIRELKFLSQTAIVNVIYNSQNKISIDLPNKMYLKILYLNDLKCILICKILYF